MMSNKESKEVPTAKSNPTHYKVPITLMQRITEKLINSEMVLKEGIQLINEIRNLETINE